MATITLACPDLADGASQIVDAEGRRILLCRSSGELKAIGGLCPHQRLSLEGARIRKGALLCPHHGARFDLATGKSLSPLTPKPLEMFPVREVDGKVEIDL